MERSRGLIVQFVNITIFVRVPGKNTQRFLVGTNLNQLSSNMLEENTKNPERVWLIMTGFSCNNNCVMCSTKPKAKFNPDRSTKDILKDLRKGKNQGYKRVEFTGGEPTIRTDILRLIKKAKDLDYNKIFHSMEKPAFIFDGRNILNHQTLYKIGFNVYPIAKPALTHF